MDVADAKRDLAVVTKWYEEAPNETSASRLVAGVAVAGLVVCVLLTIAYVVVCLAVWGKGSIDAQVIHEFGFIMLGLAGTASAAIGTRNLGVK